MRFDPRVCLRAGSGWGGYADGEPELPPVPSGVCLPRRNPCYLA